MTRTVLVDGINLEMTDHAAQVVQRAIDAANQKVADAEKCMKKSEEEMAEAKKKSSADAAIIATKDAEIVTLQTKLKDAEITPAKLDAAVMDRAMVIDKAKSILADKLITKDKTVNDIRRQVVDSRLGDVAKGWNDDQINVSFNTLTVDAKSNAGEGVRDIAYAFSAPRQGAQDEAAKAYNDMCKDLESSYQKKSAA